MCLLKREGCGEWGDGIRRLMHHCGVKGEQQRGEELGYFIDVVHVPVYWGKEDGDTPSSSSPHISVGTLAISVMEVDAV